MPSIGDVLEIQLGTAKKPRWIRFWRFPIRDEAELKDALLAVDGRAPWYSRPQPDRQYRIVAQ